MSLFLTLVIFLLILMITEYWYIRNCLKKISIRILVNGTRGKSSVTRYIAAVLRASNKKTIGKITGIIPTIIYPDGSERMIRRIGPARIQEQLRLISMASRHSIDCLVLECMSVTPELQKWESRILKPHIYVITNIRDDHREQMGNIENQVEAICNAVPNNTIVVTGEWRFLSKIKASVELKKSSLINADDTELKYPEISSCAFKSNIKTASAVCDTLKIPNEYYKDAILKCIRDNEDDLIEFYSGNNKISFINGFAVNDITSAEEFLNYWAGRLEGLKKINIIFNSRADRPLRSLLFARWFAGMENLDRIILTGTHTPRTKLELIRKGIGLNKITVLTKNKIKNVSRYLAEISHTRSVFIGFGNIAGDGLLLVNSLKKGISDGYS